MPKANNADKESLQVFVHLVDQPFQVDVRAFAGGDEWCCRGAASVVDYTPITCSSVKESTSGVARIREGIHMNRELALKIVLALVGLLFLALAYPLAMFMRQEPALSMMFSLYVTLGVFLLLAVRNPSASRTLIAFTAWSSFAHAAVMGTQALRNMISRGELIGVAVLVVIGAVLLALAPAKQPAGLTSRRSIYQPQ